MSKNLKVGSIFFEVDINALGDLQNPTPLCLKSIHIGLKQENVKVSAASCPLRGPEGDLLHRPMSQMKKMPLYFTQRLMTGDRMSHPRFLGANSSYKQLPSKGPVKMGLALVVYFLTNQNGHGAYSTSVGFCSELQACSGTGARSQECVIHQLHRPWVQVTDSSLQQKSANTVQEATSGPLPLFI